MLLRRLTVPAVGVLGGTAITIILGIVALFVARFGMHLFSSYSTQSLWTPLVTSVVLVAWCSGTMLHRRRLRRGTSEGS